MIEEDQQGTKTTFFKLWMKSKIFGHRSRISLKGIFVNNNPL